MRLNSMTKLVATFAFALSALSCSKSNTQTVTINFPDWKQLHAATYDQQSRYSSPSAAASIENAQIISVSVGSRVLPGFPWEYKKSRPNPPSNVTFEVDNGSLVQAMAILETTGGARAYYYGDAKVTQSGALTIDMTNVLTTTSGEGKVIGRYITGVDANGKAVGPTGEFQYRFDVAGTRADLADRPAMVVTTGEIFNGWMNVTTLPGQALKYSKTDGTPIFQVASSDNSMISVLNPRRAARVVVPAGYRNEKWSGGYEMRESERKEYILGYFGPGADAYSAALAGGLSLCYPSVPSYASAPAVPRLYKDLAATMSPTDPPQNQFVWGGENTSMTAAEFLRTARVTAGGAITTSGACASSALALSQNLTIDIQNLSSDDEFMGFRGPFAKRASGRFLDSSFDSGSHKVSVNWQLVPDADRVLSGVSVFYRSLAAPSNDDESIKVMDGYDCQAMRDRIPGFEDFKELQLPLTSTVADIADVADEGAAAKLQIVACPRGKDGRVFKSAVRAESSGGGGGGGSVIATKILARSGDGIVTAPAARRAHEAGACIPIHLTATDANGTPGTVQNPATVTVAPVGDANIHLFGDETCSGMGMSFFGLGNFNGSGVVFYKDASSTTRDIDFVVNPAPMMAMPDSHYYAKQMPADSTVRKLRTTLLANIYAHSCVPVTFTVDDDSVNRVSRGYIDFSTPITLDNLGGDVTYYAENDWDCSSPVSSTVYFYNNPHPQNSLRRRMVYRGTSPTGTVASLTPVTNGDVTPLAGTTTIQQPGAPAAVRIQTVSSQPSGQCQRVTVQVVDANGRPTPSTQALSMSLSASVAGVFKYNCTVGSATTQTISIGVGSSSNSMYGFEPNGLATGSNTYSLTGTGGLPVETYPVTLTPSVAAQIVFLSKGQVWDNTNHVIAGSVIPQLLNTSYAIKVYVLTADGRVADGTQNTVSFNGSPSAQITYPSGFLYADGSSNKPIAISNGFGQISVMATVNSLVNTAYGAQFSLTGLPPEIYPTVTASTMPIVPGAPVQGIVSLPSPLSVSDPLSCHPIVGKLVDSNGNVTAATETVFFDFSAVSDVVNGTIWQSSDCQSMQLTGNSYSVSISAFGNQTGGALYFKPTAPGTASFTFHVHLGNWSNVGTGIATANLTATP